LLSLLLVMVMVMVMVVVVVVVVFGPRRTEVVARHDALLAKARTKTVMSYGASCILHGEKRATEHGDQPSIDLPQRGKIPMTGWMRHRHPSTPIQSTDARASSTWLLPWWLAQRTKGHVRSAVAPRLQRARSRSQSVKPLEYGILDGVRESRCRTKSRHHVAALAALRPEARNSPRRCVAMPGEA
jgi:hypothetical protein